jgi:hypothetical protein
MNKNNLNLILKEFDNQSRDDLEIIKAVLPYCSQQICVSFALHCCLDIEPLMTDKRSVAAIRAVELFVKTGAKVSQEIVDSAYAAYAAAYASAYADAAYAAAYAYANAADAAYAAYAADAAYAAYAAYGKDPNVYKDKMRGYLNKLKELVSMEYGVELSADAAWLIAVVI